MFSSPPTVARKSKPPSKNSSFCPTTQSIDHMLMKREAIIMLESAMASDPALMGAARYLFQIDTASLFKSPTSVSDESTTQAALDAQPFSNELSEDRER